MVKLLICSFCFLQIDIANFECYENEGKQNLSNWNGGIHSRKVDQEAPKFLMRRLVRGFLFKHSYYSDVFYLLSDITVVF